MNELRFDRAILPERTAGMTCAIAVLEHPGVDILGEARKALAWANANPTKRKTARGMAKFLLSWMGRVQDRGWSGFNGHQPSVQQNLRVGHTRAEDFKHSDKTGEVDL